MLQTYYAAVLKEHFGSTPVLMVTYFAASAVLEDAHHLKGDNQPGDHSRGAYCSGRRAPSRITVGSGSRSGDLATFATVTHSAGGNSSVNGRVTVKLSTMRITGWSCPF
jgi:hypothetical protein